MPSTLVPPLAFQGEFLTAADHDYEQHRPIFLDFYNDRYPIAIARCHTASDVAAMVAFGQEQGLEIAVRAGKHSMPGYSNVDGGLVIDLAPMKEVALDRERRVLRVGAGVTSGDLLSRDPRSGYAPITGLDGRPGLVGLTLHGGRGFLSRQHGWASDHIRSAEVVTADGRVLQASAGETEDLLYGIRGAGSNFGVVTRLELDVHRIPEAMIGGFLLYAGPDLPRVIPELMGALESGALSEALGIVLWASADALGATSMMVFVTHCGDAETVQRDVAFLRAVARPVVDQVHETTYADVVGSVPPRPHSRFFWTEQGCDELGDAFDQTLLEHIARLPAARTPGQPNHGIYVEHFGPGYRKMPALPTPVPRRRGASVGFLAEWSDPAEDESFRAWVRAEAEALRSSGVGGGLQTLNFNYETSVRGAYGDEAYERLRALKAVYDPANVFHLNHNVVPAGSTTT